MNRQAVPSVAMNVYAKLCEMFAVYGRGIGRSMGLMCGLFVIGVCDAAQSVNSASAGGAPLNASAVQSPIWMTVNDRRFAITLADTAAAREFVAMLPLSITMPDLNGNEKHARLSRPLATDAIRPGTIHNGDLMLYGSQTLVLFYQSFTSAYSYTRLGRVDDPRELDKTLGSDVAKIGFSRD
jgi:hypothetical protein